MAGFDLQPFFWNKVANNAAADTVWNAIEDDEELDLTDVVRAFSADTKLAAKPVLAAKNQVTSLLPLQRAQNIGEYLLSSMSLSSM